MTHPSDQPTPPPQASEFVRPSLALTRDGLIEAEGEVIARCDELEELIEHRRAGGLDSRGVLRLLASIAWLERVRPVLRDRFARSAELKTACAQVVDELRVEEVEEALRCIDVPAWLERLRRIEDDIGDVSREIDDEAAVLLEALDDADLAAIVASRLGVNVEPLRDELFRCNIVVEDHADLLTGASGYAQAVAAGFREDIDPDGTEEAFLFASTAKFIAVLDACERFERELLGEREREQSVREPLGEPVGKSAEVPVETAVEASGLLLAARGVAARNDTIERFQSPDGGFQAFLALPGKRDPRAEVEMEFVTGDDAPASALLGQLVLFCDQRCRIGVNYSGEVVARFPITAVVRVLAEERALVVGDTTWIRVQP